MRHFLCRCSYLFTNSSYLSVLLTYSLKINSLLFLIHPVSLFQRLHFAAAILSRSWSMTADRHQFYTRRVICNSRHCDVDHATKLSISWRRVWRCEPNRKSPTSCGNRGIADRGVQEPARNPPEPIKLTNQTFIYTTRNFRGKKGSPHSITERRVPELIPVPGSHKSGGRLPLLSARPTVTRATLKRAATSFAAWRTEARWVWAVCLRLLPDSVATAIWTRAFCAWVQHANHSATEPPFSGLAR